LYLSQLVSDFIMQWGRDQITRQLSQTREALIQQRM
jgi:hypothetical protein